MALSQDGASTVKPSSNDIPSANTTPPQRNATMTSQFTAMTENSTSTKDSTISTNSTAYSNSSSDPSSSDSSSPATTPESDDSGKELKKPAASAKAQRQTRRLTSHTSDEERTRFPELHGPAPKEAAHHSSRPSKSVLRNGKPRKSSAARRLGAISETSDDIAPDIPTRNPRRVHFANLGNFTSSLSAAAAAKARYYSDHRNLFAWATKKGRGEDIEEDPKIYEKIVGPGGEKFSDVRANAALPERPETKRRRNFICCGILLVLIILIALIIGLAVGLSQLHKQKQGPTIPVPANSSATLPFPLGTWQIPTYLTNTSTACTAVSATWACYPYTTYSQNQNTSYSPLVWRITSPKNTTLDLQISNTDPSFSYAFTSVPLTLVNASDPETSAFWFNTTFQKQVLPTIALTSDGTASRCYYNNTNLSVKLYSTGQGGSSLGAIKGGMPNSTVSGEGVVEQWPYAIEYFESITEEPTCYEFINGANGAQINVQAVQGTEGMCSCSYRNFGL